MGILAYLDHLGAGEWALLGLRSGQGHPQCPGRKGLGEHTALLDHSWSTFSAPTPLTHYTEERCLP